MIQDINQIIHTLEDMKESFSEDVPSETKRDFIIACNTSIKILEKECKILEFIKFSMDASTGDSDYMIGFRNGLRYVKSMMDGKDPEYEHTKSGLNFDVNKLNERNEYT